MTKSGAGRKSLKKYEVTNLFFFLGLILALGVLVTLVFRFYGTRDSGVSGEGERGIISESLSPDSDIAVFYVGTKLFETSSQYESILEVPVTDDGFLKELFSIPGIMSITADRRSIMIRKQTSADWENIRPGVRKAIERHLHLHY
ncbi:MAG: NifU N-terminal domain-containing protein [Acidobacteriota bacterium]|jgi:hypothetical protein